MAYFTLEPFGDDLFDLQLASLQALLANVNTDPKKGRRFEPKQFELRNQVPQEAEELSPRQIYRRLKMNLGLG